MYANFHSYTALAQLEETLAHNEKVLRNLDKRFVKAVQKMNACLHNIKQLDKAFEQLSRIGTKAPAEK